MIAITSPSVPAPPPVSDLMVSGKPSRARRAESTLPVSLRRELRRVSAASAKCGSMARARDVARSAFAHLAKRAGQQSPCYGIRVSRCMCRLPCGAIRYSIAAYAGYPLPMICQVSKPQRTVTHEWCSIRDTSELPSIFCPVCGLGRITTGILLASTFFTVS
jgi:hypothetical protein